MNLGGILATTLGGLLLWWVFLTPTGDGQSWFDKITSKKTTTGNPGGASGP